MRCVEKKASSFRRIAFYHALSLPLSLSTCDMESTASTPSDLHGLTAGQLSELQGAVQALDAHLLVCVDDLRNNRWTRPNAKHVADCLVRELAVISFFFLRRKN